MDKKRKYLFSMESLDGDADELTTRLATVERLEAIVEELAELNKGMRFLAVGAGLENLLKNPEALRELFGADPNKPPPSDSPPSQT